MKALILSLLMGSGIIVESPQNFNYHLRYAAGDVPGYSQIYKFGYNSDVDQSFEDIWSGGGDYTGFVTSAETINISSSSTDDDGDPAGTGAHSAVIYGLDSNWNSATETVTLDGTSTVTTSTSFYRVFRIAIAAAGSGEINAGLLTATQTISGAVMARVEIAQGQSEMLIFAVPTGCVLYFDRFFTQVDGTKTADFYLNVRTGLDTSTPAKRIVGEFQGIGGTFGIDFDYGGQASGPADVWISARGDALNTLISGQGLGVQVCE